MFPASILPLGLFLAEAPVGIPVKYPSWLHYCPQASLAELALFHLIENGQVNDGIGPEEGVYENGALP